MRTPNLRLGLQLGLILSLSAACGKSSSSGLDGHFENGSVADLQKLNGAQRATAEYETSQGVIISWPLIKDFGKTDLAAAILKAGVENLWIAVPSNYSSAQNAKAESALIKATGSNVSKIKLLRQQTSGTLTVWARDWSPLSAKTKEGGIRLLDFNYYPERNADDYTAQTFERLLDFDRLSVPVYNEGGNFMNNTLGHCMMTTRVTDANAQREQSDDYILNAADIQTLYGAAAGCKKTTIFPRMPYEGTGHIDMWAKFLNDNTVIVSELRNEVLALYSGSQKTKTANIQKYLNDRAADITKLGYKVVRIPLPGPVWSSSGDVFRSYTNSLLVNGNALVPRYVTPAYDDLATSRGTYLDESYRAKYEAEVSSVYKDLGFPLTWIPSDDLIAVGGAVHCTTMQIAK